MATHEIEYIELDGHKIDPAIIDRFFDMKTGERITNEQWDREVVILAAGETDDGQA